jgi:hypothetical protein
MYRSPSDKFKIIVNYDYGFNAIRDHGRGANSFGILLQIDLEKAVGSPFRVTHPSEWNGWNHIFNR